MYLRNTILLLHPVSVTVPSVPGGAPSNNSGRILAPGKIKKGDTLYPRALPHPIPVTSDLDPEVTACGLKSQLVTTAGGVCEV